MIIFLSLLFGFLVGVFFTCHLTVKVMRQCADSGELIADAYRITRIDHL